MATQRRVLIIDRDQGLFSALEQHRNLLKDICFQFINSYPLPDEPWDAVICALAETPETLPGAGYKLRLTDRPLTDAESALFDASLSRPFRLGRLLALLSSALQEDRFPPGPLAAGSCVLLPREKTLNDEKSGKSISLTEKETQLLLALCEAAPASASRETLLEKVWQYNSGLSTHTVETHIYRLRQKIEQGLGHAEFILTKQGGYSLTGN